MGFRDPDVSHILKGTREDIIACVHGDPIVPLRLDGRLTSPELRIINDVIMDEGGHMHELEGYGRMFDHVDIIVAILCREQDKYRSYPFTSGLKQVKGSLL